MLEERSRQIQPVSNEWKKKAKERLDNLTKPRGSLGFLEELAARYAAIRKQVPLDLPKKKIYVFVGDHGVVSEGVSAYPAEVTALMVKNFLIGKAGINVLAKYAGANVSVVDIGMKEDIQETKGLIRKKIKRGTDNIAVGPAMSRREAESAVSVGIEMADRAYFQGTTMIGTGEMGIGNTTPSAALFAALLSVDPLTVTGRGTGLDNDALKKKAHIIGKALEVNKASLIDPIGTLAAVGGLEIAGICGLCLGGAARGLAVVVDGFISTAGALVALRINPMTRDYLFFSHKSFEKGHEIFFKKERIRPILDLDLRLGEGTGGALAMQIIEGSVRLLNDMATFAEMGIEPGA
jgi:nicotinate-nucleotide--dimethylbenzimidazole phosphoribosyltransferase